MKQTHDNVKSYKHDEATNFNHNHVNNHNHNHKRKKQSISSCFENGSENHNVNLSQFTKRKLMFYKSVLGNKRPTLPCLSTKTRFSSRSEYYLTWGNFAADDASAAIHKNLDVSVFF